MSCDAETIERAELADIHAAATAELRQALGLQLLDVGGVLVSVAAGLPDSAIVINRAIAPDLPARPDPSVLAKIVDTYGGAGVGRYFLQLLPRLQTTDLLRDLRELGLEKSRGWQKFRRGREPVDEPETELVVREVGAGEGVEFARIACNAFDLGEAAIPWLAALPGRPGWHIFMSFCEGRAAGVGGLFVQEELAWLDFGATAPEFRQRGSQGAVLAARLKMALDLGCRDMYTCTGVAAAGDPQHSYRNILRAGFRTDYIRDNFEPA